MQIKVCAILIDDLFCKATLYFVNHLVDMVKIVFADSIFLDFVFSLLYDMSVYFVFKEKLFCCLWVSEDPFHTVT